MTKRLMQGSVQVVLVVTGGVKSRISDVKKQLPRDSLYMPIEDKYSFRQGNSQRKLNEAAMVEGEKKGC